MAKAPASAGTSVDSGNNDVHTPWLPQRSSARRTAHLQGRSSFINRCTSLYTWSTRGGWKRSRDHALPTYFTIESGLACVKRVPEGRESPASCISSTNPFQPLGHSRATAERSTWMICSDRSRVEACSHNMAIDLVCSNPKK